MELPEPWKSQGQAKLQAILQMDRTTSAFAQLFQGCPTTPAILEMNDAKAYYTLNMAQNVTKEAWENAGQWLGDIRQLFMRTSISIDGSIEAWLASSNAHKIKALVQDFIRPVVRSCVKGYLSQRAVDKPLTYAKWQARGEIDVKAVEDWVEEYMFGGLLEDNKDGQLIVKRSSRTWFTISYHDLWETQKLPLHDTTNTNRTGNYPRLENDTGLLKYMETRKA